ncbi:MAG: type I methionyl aminopeptidase [Phycisphaerae bacterium]|nr:type I methionyl aminopeptidase [Tepidisphaeraceae bacterium]
MPINLKSRREIELMRRAGQVACNILAKMREAAVPGVTTAELDQLAAREMAAHGALSGSRNYPTYKPGEGYPGYTCISVNDEVVHGIPGGRTLKEGDVVTLDVALQVSGYFADTATTVPVGRISAEYQKLLDVTKETLFMAIRSIKPGKRWSEIARLMQHYVEQIHGYSMVREFVGHGVGRSMHEEPRSVANFVTGEQRRGDFELKPGLTIAVEPMVVMGRRDVVMRDDQWTVVTEDGKPAAHFEHTVAVTATGADVLTDGRPPNL